MENEIPKIDIPEDSVAGVSAAKELLNLYINYPCRLKAGIFVLLLDGAIEASINLVKYKIETGSLISLLPQSILQVHKTHGNPRVYFLGFSSEFLQNNNIIKVIPDHYYQMRETPIILLEPQNVPIFEHLFTFLQQAQDNGLYPNNPEICQNILQLYLLYIKDLYKKIMPTTSFIIKSKKIAKEFSKLVIQHYIEERNISFYAKMMHITPSHLSSTIKEATGKTCTEIISAMVVMDAKTQLKNTDLPISQIAYSLNFTNMSFFGKYFKRHVGMSPQEYRNN